MKKLVLTFSLILYALLMQAQIKAISENGDEVVLYKDGTWKYTEENTVKNSAVPLSDKIYTKDKASTFLVKSKKLNIGVWINPKSWSFTKGTENDAHEFLFQKKGDDLYAMLIAEKMEIPIESLKNIAFENAKSAAPDIKVTKEEYRDVNGIRVLMMQMTGTIQGIRFSYYGYYYSNSQGTIQLLAYTGESLMNQQIGNIETFLNGLVEY